MDRAMYHSGCDFLLEDKLAKSMYELRKKTLSFVHESEQFLKSFPEEDKCALCPNSYECLAIEREALPFIIEFIKNSVPREAEELYDKIEMMKKFSLEPEQHKQHRAEEQVNLSRLSRGLTTLPRECWGPIGEGFNTEKDQIIYLKEEIQGLKRDRSFYEKELLKAQQKIANNLAEKHWGFGKCKDCGNILYSCCSVSLSRTDYSTEEVSSSVENYRMGRNTIIACKTCGQELKECCLDNE